MTSNLRIRRFISFAQLGIQFMLLTISFSLANAQLNAVWTRVYDGPEGLSESATSCITDDEGNIYVAGNIYSSSTRNDFLLIKYTSSGVVEWETKYSRPNYSDDICKSFTRDKNKNFYLVGSGNYEGPLIIVKFDKDGKKIWERTYNDFTYGFIDVVTVLTDNNENVIVRCDDFIAGMTILKYDSAGTNLWVRKYADFISYFVPSNMAVDKEGNIYACGDKYGAGSDDIALVKYSPQGDTLWTRIYDSGLYEHSSDLELDDSGNIYIAGETGGSPFFYYGYKYVTIKYDNNGNRIWLRRYDGGGNDRDCAYNLAVDKYHNVYTTGQSSGQWNYFDFATVKYNRNGDSVWTRRYNGQANLDDYGERICIDIEGNLIVSGSSFEKDSTYDIVTVAYNSLGQQIGIAEFNGPLEDDDRFSDLHCSQSGEIIICGTTKSFHSNNSDILLIKYKLTKSPVSVNQGNSELNTESFELEQNYPNPFNPDTRIKYRLKTSGETLLNVFDLTGQIVRTLVEKKQVPGVYEVEFNASELASGVYFYSLSTDGQLKGVRKLMLVK